MAGTQEDVAQQAAARLKNARRHADECGRAQAGTPLGSRLGEARREAEQAQRAFDSAFGAYERHMGSNAKSRSSFGV